MKNNKIFSLILEPNLILHKKSLPVPCISLEVKKLSNNLIDTMRYYKALGIAAVQIGVLKKIVAINALKVNTNNYSLIILIEDHRILINPKIIKKSIDTKIYFEGCLSFKNIFPKVKRFNLIKIKYIDIRGKEKCLEVSDNIISSCLQHEIDHTSGVIFLDKLSRVKKEFMIKKYSKLQKEF